MAVTNGYATVAELRDHLGDTGSKLDADLLDKAINAASRAIDDHCGRRFWLDSSVVTRAYKVDSPDVAWVDDIGTITGLIVKTDGAGDYTWDTTWLSTEYDLEPDNADSSGGAYAWWRIVALDDVFPVSERRKTLQVTAKFGWSAVPDPVNLACIIKAAQLFRRKDAVFGIAAFADFGPMRITRRDPDVMDLLNGFVKYDIRSV